MKGCGESRRKQIVILGGGITGLSAAFYVQKYVRKHRWDADITLVEQTERLGGKIDTLHRDGFIIEKGPDSFLARKTPILELTQQLGLIDELVATGTSAKKTYILHQGRFHRMPPGLVLGLPTRLRPFLATGLVSPLGKMRALFDFVLPARKQTSDESLGHFISRRLGKEVLHNLTEPLLAGIYAGDTDHLSLQATFPQFQAMEREKRSLILGMAAGRKPAGASSRNATSAASKDSASPVIELPEAVKGSVFLSYGGGLSMLVDRLAESLDRVSIVKGRRVERIEVNRPGAAETAAKYTIVLATSETAAEGLSGTSALEADAMIVTLPAYAAATLFPDMPETVQLERISHVSVANIAIAYARSDFPHKLDGSGFLVPRKENRFITACTWTSAKWPHTAPAGKVLLRCYVGRSGAEQWIQLSDDELLAKVRADLRELMGIDAEPLFYELTRWHRGMPQYAVGHLDRIGQFRQRLSERMPGVVLAGAGYEGVGLPDCIGQGQRAAERIIAQLAEQDM